MNSTYSITEADTYDTMAKLTILEKLDIDSFYQSIRRGLVQTNELVNSLIMQT
jgi:hypothetical protein